MKTKISMVTCLMLSFLMLLTVFPADALAAAGPELQGKWTSGDYERFSTFTYPTKNAIIRNDELPIKGTIKGGPYVEYGCFVSPSRTGDFEDTIAELPEYLYDNYFISEDWGSGGSKTLNYNWDLSHLLFGNYTAWIYALDRFGNYYYAWVDFTLAPDTSTNGWYEIEPDYGDNIWYYFTNGNAATMWRKIGGSWYFFDTDGIMQLRWVEWKNKWYYMDPNGVMATGWRKSGGDWYYLRPITGEMATSWVQWKGGWYYLRSSGKMATGWLEWKGKWYYLGSSGKMATGWLEWRGRWYYLNPSSGAMLTGNQNIGGRMHRFDGNGAWLGYLN